MERSLRCREYVLFTCSAAADLPRLFPRVTFGSSKSLSIGSSTSGLVQDKCTIFTTLAYKTSIHSGDTVTLTHNASVIYYDESGIYNKHQNIVYISYATNLRFNKLTKKTLDLMELSTAFFVALEHLR